MDYVGLLVEILYIFSVIKVATVLLNKKKIGLEESRKFIHIALCNTYLIAIIFFSNVYIASILPFLFVIINCYSHKYKTISAIERIKDNGLGTIWYALSILILIVAHFSMNKYIYIGVLAILILGYADGLAGLIGYNIGHIRFKNKKSLEGSLVFFGISFIISYVILKMNFYDNVIVSSLLISTYGTIIEVLCTKGFDNLFVPLGLSVIIYFLTVSSLFFNISVALCINLMIGLFANALNFFDLKGTLGAIVLGFVVYYFGGFSSYIALISYIVFANIIGIFNKKKKKSHEKRGIKQVVCNGLISFVSIILYVFLKNDICLGVYLLGLAGSCSDTFGGDFGKTSNEEVKYLISRKEVSKGSSGGVTKRGLVGSLIASVFMGLFSFIIFSKNKVLLFLMISFFGFLSSIIDSVMGEVIQVKYKDKSSGKIFEKVEKRDKKTYEKVSGISFIGNSMVNFLSVLISCILFIVVYYLII